MCSETHTCSHPDCDDPADYEIRLTGLSADVVSHWCAPHYEDVFEYFMQLSEEQRARNAS